MWNRDGKVTKRGCIVKHVTTVSNYSLISLKTLEPVENTHSPELPDLRCCRTGIESLPGGLPWTIYPSPHVYFMLMGRTLSIRKDSQAKRCGYWPWGFGPEYSKLREAGQGFPGLCQHSRVWTSFWRWWTDMLHIFRERSKKQNWNCEVDCFVENKGNGEN